MKDAIRQYLNRELNNNKNQEVKKLGSVSGNANVFPEIFIEFYQAIKEKNYDKAHEKQIIIRHIARILKNGASLAYFKQALIYRGFMPIYTRKPLLNLARRKKIY